jgi:hypothetical protein
LSRCKTAMSSAGAPASPARCIVCVIDTASLHGWLFLTHNLSSHLA